VQVDAIQERAAELALVARHLCCESKLLSFGPLWNQELTQQL
jgi:hypothetical protein